MQERAFADPKLEIVWNSVVEEINGDDRLESLTLRDTKTGVPGARRDRTVHRGRSRPALRLLVGQVDLDDNGYVLVEQPSTATNLPGVFAAATWSTTSTAGGHRGRHRLRGGPDAERFLATLDHAAATGEEARTAVATRRLRDRADRGL